MYNNTIDIYKKNLPTKKNEELEFIYDYFEAFEIESIEMDEYYKIKTSAKQYTYCEDIAEGLKYLGISINDVANYCCISKNMALCLSENWLTYALVNLIEKNELNDKSITIIHIDDHKDMMSPFIGYKEGIYYNLITKEDINFRDSNSIRKAIKSGAITIGSILTVFAYMIEEIDIIHIKKNLEYEEYGFTKDTFIDSIIHEKCERICIKKDRAAFNRYYAISDWKKIIKKIKPESTCILHIDMDYFNNRYNASTDWMNNNDRHDPSINEQKKEMDYLIEGIKKINEVTPIKYLLLGISPSFYPVEYWEEGINYLVSNLEKIGIGIGKEIINYWRNEE